MWSSSGWGAAASELRERLLAAEGREKERYETMARLIEVLREAVEKMQMRRAAGAGSSSAPGAGSSGSEIGQ